MRAGGFSGAGSCCAETVSGRTARVWLRPRHISNCAEKRSRFRLAALQKQRGVLGRPCIKSVCGVSQPILSKKCPRCPRSVTPQKQHALLGRSCRKQMRRAGSVAYKKLPPRNRTGECLQIQLSFGQRSSRFLPRTSIRCGTFLLASDRMPPVATFLPLADAPFTQTYRYRSL